MAKFQSTAGPKTGCTPPCRPTCPCRPAGGFNPQPARRPAAPWEDFQFDPLFSVSIHSRPEDRLHRGGRAGRDPASTRFNPQPARRPAAPAGRPCGTIAAPCFNPQPARRPAAPWRGASSSNTSCVFQSTAGPKTGCTVRAPCCVRAATEVSIHSRPEDRLHRRVDRAGVQDDRVSIHSRPEDRLHRLDEGDLPGDAWVSIHSRPEDRLHHGHIVEGGFVGVVSIHSRPEDRLHPVRRGCA